MSEDFIYDSDSGKLTEKDAKKCKKCGKKANVKIKLPETDIVEFYCYDCAGDIVDERWGKSEYRGMVAQAVDSSFYANYESIGIIGRGGVTIDRETQKAYLISGIWYPKKTVVIKSKQVFILKAFKIAKSKQMSKERLEKLERALLDVERSQFIEDPFSSQTKAMFEKSKKEEIQKHKKWIGEYK